MARRRSRAARRRCRPRRHRGCRPGGRHAREARWARVRPRRRPGRSRGDDFSYPGDRESIRRSGDRRCSPSRAACLVAKSGTILRDGPRTLAAVIVCDSSAASRSRLACEPDSTQWQRSSLGCDARRVESSQPPPHARLSRRSAENGDRGGRRGAPRGGSPVRTADRALASALQGDPQRRDARPRGRARAGGAAGARGLGASRTPRRVRARSPSLASARHGAPLPVAVRCSAHPCPRSLRSVRPTRLSTIRCSRRQGRGMKCSNRYL